MDFLGRFRVITYLLVLISITAFATAEQDIPVLLVATGAIAMSWWLVDRTGGHAVPRWLINFGVLLASLLLFYEIVLSRNEGGNLLFGLGHFMIAILMCKMFEAKVSRDYTQILTLTLLIIVAGAFFSTSLYFGFLLLLYMMLGLFGILLFYLHREQSRQMRTSPVPQPLPGPITPAVKRDLRRIISVSTGVLVLLTLMIFLAVPRSNNREIFVPWAIGRMNPQTGFSNQVHFGEFGTMQQSDEIVMEVRLEQGGAPIGSSSMEPYFRGMTLDSYEGNGWKRSQSDRMTERDYDLDDGPRQLIPRRLNSKDPPNFDAGLLTQHYTMHAGANRNNVLFGVFPPVAIESRQLHTITLDRRDLMITFRGQPGERFEYDIQSPLVYRGGVTADNSNSQPLVKSLMNLWGNGASDADKSAASQTAIPVRIVQMAHQVAGDLDPGSKPLTPELTLKLSSRIEDYLRTHYPYSLKMGTVDFAIDPTEDFLLNRQQIGGHCEYFASAMILMCRALGIQARMVTGYHGGEYNQVGGYYLVRQLYAHAWVEVYASKLQGWVPFDPSPSSAEKTSDEYSMVRWFREWTEYLKSQWLNGIVDFDNVNRQQIIDFFKITLWGSVVAFAQWAVHSVAAIFGGTGQPRDLATSVGLLFGAIFLTGLLVKRRFDRQHGGVTKMLAHMQPTLRHRMGRDLAFFDRFLAVLRRAGLRRAAAQTPREFADSIQPPWAHQDASWLVDQFYAVRFGTVQMTTALRTQVDQTLARLKNKLNQPEE